MSRARWFAVLGMLAACSTEPPPVSAPGYRDTGVMISSIVSFDPARFAGTWYEVASYPTPARQGCSDTQLRVTTAPEGLGLVESCRRDGAVSTVVGTARMTGPGRLEIQSGGTSASYWVLWVDEGYRTVVLGTPSGRDGRILNRDPVIPADRLSAAREILDFNGYDLSALRITPQGGG